MSSHRRRLPPTRRSHGVDYATLRAIAVRASADPRTVAAELCEPGSTRGMTGSRIRAALAELGMLPPSAAPSLDSSMPYLQARSR